MTRRPDRPDKPARKLKVQLTPEQVAESGKDLDNFHGDKARRNKDRRNKDRNRFIRLKADGQFEGLVWIPGQQKLNKTTGVVYPAELLSDAVRAYAKDSRTQLIEWDPTRSASTPSLGDVVGEVVFVQENPDGSITVRGRLIPDTHRGEVLKGLWTSLADPYGVVPWKIASKGLGHVSDEGVCEELQILGFEIMEG